MGALLAWQGAAWLVLAIIGLGVWLGTLRSGLVLGNPTAVALWKSGELLAIALGAGIGSAQLSMACRLRGGCGLVRATAAALRALTVASGLIAGAVSVLLVGSVMELIVLNGTLAGFLPPVGARRAPAGLAPPAARHAPRRSRPDTVMVARIGRQNGDRTALPGGHATGPGNVRGPSISYLEGPAPIVTPRPERARHRHAGAARNQAPHATAARRQFTAGCAPGSVWL